MWSRKGMPEASSASPRPSSSTATKIFVSFVSRWISALRMESAQEGAEDLDEPAIFLGGADRESQAICEERVRAMESANQYTTLPEGFEGARPVGNADQ